MEHIGVTYTAMVVSMIGMLGILVWGMKRLSTVFSSDTKSGQTFWKEALVDDQAPLSPDGHDPKASFSRMAGAIGTLALAATLVGVGIWCIYSLYLKPANLQQLEHLGTFFLSGAALFAPYAVNQLTKIFKT